ncbi:MBL fold metallo-hydrolase [Fibrobacter sp. UWB12]|uniref:MBL fold metallo-hydrolase n=1 Tax=Fibrobacter sp. UWB12 TaxID=1896203 RepID=UPI00091AE137|nr:MBL fold metallo-hydrolase [Fibrobacter sp. UWB12]SHK90305.1 Glyoxylase, beta-lactamase superfamily II [Fibrobacter sp. UWB12]
MTIYNIGNRVVNNYLFAIDEGYILIDTGYENGFARFQRNLKKLNIQPSEIKFIFLTHAHDDHAGFLNKVLAITNAKVILHPKAIERLKSGQNSFEGGCSSMLAYIFCKLFALFGKSGHKFPPIKDEYLNRLITTDSQEFRNLNLPIQAFETPGHTADHISLLKGGILFCGDAAMNGFPSIKRNIIWIENLQDYRKSWEKMIAFNPAKIYPSHGKPFDVNDLKRFIKSIDKIKLRPL